MSKEDSECGSGSNQVTSTPLRRQPDYGAVAPDRVLLIDYDESHARRLVEYLHLHGFLVDLSVGVVDATLRLKRHSAQYEIVILNVSDSSQPWLRSLHTLDEASRNSTFGVCPLFLCVSTVRREPLFELQIEQMGARLVYER